MDEEKQWIKRIQTKSSEEAANSLIAAYYKEMFAYVYKQTLNKELSMDLTQEIFISMLRSICYFDGRRAAFRTWLYRIATNRVVDYFRSKAYKYHVLTASMEECEEYEEVDFTTEFETKQDIERILVYVSSLDVSRQQIFRLKFFAEQSFSDISETLGIPESTVKTKYYSLVRMIKNYVQEVTYE